MLLYVRRKRRRNVITPQKEKLISDISGKNVHDYFRLLLLAEILLKTTTKITFSQRKILTLIIRYVKKKSINVFLQERRLKTYLLDDYITITSM